LRVVPILLEMIPGIRFSNERFQLQSPEKPRTYSLCSVVLMDSCLDCHPPVLIKDLFRVIEG
jgi:hypothetical protein